jgi:two-component system, NtrC family, nitrogen regulation sensor histidine kinase GlnL
MTAAPDAQRLLASLPLAVVVLAPGQSVSAANPVAEQFFGQSLRRLSGRALGELMSFADARLAARLEDDQAPVSARDVAVTVAGQGQRRVDLATAPLLDQPGWQILTLNDSTTAGALGDDRRGDDFAALRAPEVLAHEIKNPLAGIRGAAQLLARTAGPKEQALTTLIAEEVDRVAKLIDQMQTLSRRTAAPVAACNLHEAVRRASAVLDVGGGGPVIGEEFDPSLPPVLGSADGLVQVLINLLSNAREASRTARDPRVIVRTRFASGLQFHAPGSGKPVRLPIELRVSDNGPGIDPAIRDHLFEPFVSSKKSGQGLGLALVRKLVRDMNGRIGHERDDAAGWTHFRVHLPLAGDASGKREAVA